MSSKSEDTRTRILEATWKLLETQPGKRISMSQIAAACELSRQAVYLHFASRTELLIATTHYVDEVKGLEQRLQKLESASTGAEMLQMCIEIWGRYIPEIYGVAKALMMTKDNDEAAAAAWSDVMGCLRDVCAEIVQRLQAEKRLADGWDTNDATDYLWVMISIQNWEQLTRECGWSDDSYVESMVQSLTAALIKQ